MNPSAYPGLCGGLYHTSNTISPPYFTPPTTLFLLLGCVSTPANSSRDESAILWRGSGGDPWLGACRARGGGSGLLEIRPEEDNGPARARRRRQPERRISTPICSPVRWVAGANGGQSRVYTNSLPRTTRRAIELDPSNAERPCVLELSLPVEQPTRRVPDRLWRGRRSGQPDTLGRIRALGRFYFTEGRVTMDEGTSRLFKTCAWSSRT